MILSDIKLNVSGLYPHETPPEMTHMLTLGRPIRHGPETCQVPHLFSVTRNHVLPDPFLAGVTYTDRRTDGWTDRLIDR